MSAQLFSAKLDFSCYPLKWLGVDPNLCPSRVSDTHALLPGVVAVLTIPTLDGAMIIDGDFGRG